MANSKACKPQAAIIVFPSKKWTACYRVSQRQVLLRSGAARLVTSADAINSSGRLQTSESAVCSRK